MTKARKDAHPSQRAIADAKVSVEDHRDAEDKPTGEALVTLLKESSLGDIDMERSGPPSPVRGVDL